MKALVTGASGFLGGWLCKALCEKGWEVHVLLRPTSDRSSLKNLNLHFHTGDVTDLDSFMQASQGVEIVFHLAGLVAHTSNPKGFIWRTPQVLLACTTKINPKGFIWRTPQALLACTTKINPKGFIWRTPQALLACTTKINPKGFIWRTPQALLACTTKINPKGFIWRTPQALLACTTKINPKGFIWRTPQALLACTTKINPKGFIWRTPQVLLALKEGEKKTEISNTMGIENMQKVNVQGTAHAIEVCQAQKAKLIHISSVVAVGASKKPSILNEQSPYDPSLSEIGYFHTKKQAEILVQKACKEGKITAVILNPSTIYGPGDMKKESRRVQLKVAQGRFPFYTSGGVSVVDVESVVSACIKAVEKGRLGERYILSGENISIKELFSLIAKANGVRPPFIYLNNFILNRLAEMGEGLQRLGFSFPIQKESARLATLYHWFDHSKAKQELEFTPMTAKQAIKNSIQWWQNE